jgi:hypothetical protein
MGVKIERVMTDNRTGYKNAFKAACDELGSRWWPCKPAHWQAIVADTVTAPGLE